MALALNNLKRVDMPLNKETKPNHPLWQLQIANPISEERMLTTSPDKNYYSKGWSLQIGVNRNTQVYCYYENQNKLKLFPLLLKNLNSHPISNMWAFSSSMYSHCQKQNKILYEKISERKFFVHSEEKEEILMWGQIVVSTHYYIIKKRSTGMRTRILKSFKKFNDSQKENPCAISRRKKKMVVSDRASIKTPNVKARVEMLSGIKMLKLKAGVEMLSSGQELKCWSQRQELKCCCQDRN